MNKHRHTHTQTQGHSSTQEISTHDCTGKKNAGKVVVYSSREKKDILVILGIDKTKLCLSLS